MQNDERDLLEVLKSELEFLEQRGYQRSPETAWRPKYIFEDSPSCINYNSDVNPRPCTDCALIYLVPPARLKQVPGNQVNVVLTVTPNLRHVRSVGVMGQRMVGRVEPPVPPVMKRLQLLPLLTPLALTLGAVIGDDGVALAPISPSPLHAVLAVLAGAALGAAVYGVSFLLQRQMMTQVQALIPKT